MRRLTLLISIGIAIVILVGGCASRQATIPAAGPEAGPSPTPSVLGASPQPASTSTPPAPSAQPSPTPAPQPPPVAQPKRIEIPAIGVDAGFENLGLTQDKALDAPKDPDKVGWYRLGPRPGDKGNALLDGHVDWGGKTRVFWGLRNLKPGDKIVITDEDGKKHEFAVQWSKWYDANAPVTDTFAQTDQTELTMVTCGGEFDHTTHQYLSRLVVRAKSA